MAAVESNMMPLGTVAPDFDLPDVISGKNKTLEDVRLEYGLVVMFICAHCPFVKNIEEEIAVIALARMLCKCLQHINIIRTVVTGFKL